MKHLPVFNELAKYYFDYHPHLFIANGKEVMQELIQKRIDDAQEIYTKTLEDGGDFQLADELSHQAKYEGIKFSPIAFLNTILCVELDKEIILSETLPYYWEVEHLFKQYDIHDDFESTSEAVELTNKIVEFYQS